LMTPRRRVAIPSRLRTTPTGLCNLHEQSRNLEGRKWGAAGFFALQKRRAVNVRFGSEADMCSKGQRLPEARQTSSSVAEKWLLGRCHQKPQPGPWFEGRSRRLVVSYFGDRGGEAGCVISRALGSTRIIRCEVQDCESTWPLELGA
jgi:hypothetical protein